MKLKSLVLAVAVIASGVGAQAGTLGVFLNQTAPGFWSAAYDSKFIVGSVLGGSPMVAGTDTVTFDDFLSPLAAGQYDVELTFHELLNGTMSSTDPINVTSALLNGQMPAFQGKRTFTIATVGGISPPFVLTLMGNTNALGAGYQGTITVTAVPEPETYALLLAGLGLMGTIARRRNNKKALDAV